MGFRTETKMWVPPRTSATSLQWRRYKRSATSNPLACEICSNSFSEDHLPRILRCSHTFCTHCLHRTISSRRRACPMCQEAFTATSVEEIMINRNLLAVAKRLLSVRKVPEISGPIELQVSFVHTTPEASSSSSTQSAPRTSHAEWKKSSVRTASQTSCTEQKTSSERTASQISVEQNESPGASFEKRKAATLKASAKAQEDLDEAENRIRGLISSYDQMRQAILETNDDIDELKDMMEHLQMYNKRLFRGICERANVDMEEPSGKKASWKGASSNAL